MFLDTKKLFTNNKVEVFILINDFFDFCVILANEKVSLCLCLINKLPYYLDRMLLVSL